MSKDQQLLKRLRCGDTRALRLIYEQYMDDLLTVATSLLSDVHAAEDCVHDVFVSFAGAVNKLTIHHNLKGYLLSCVANRARDQLRKNPKKAVQPLDVSDCPTTSGEPTSKLIDFEQATRILEALAKLPHEQREVFVLHAQGGAKFREIARLIGVSVGTVQSRYRYGIEKLRILLDKENDNEVSR
ncbi:MAG: RNA polymerase sigma factor [Planctomycetota bacterium]